ncbi:MAG TPA: hypothetical protein VFR90_13285 [Methylibium sp.]|uniref:hypothetical protein n=1 Tax=Methylibium sp. TaxID=2067992 RepID=UPI002DBC9BCC|nr:hypothetical protein [Methylibium sp.]HEU4460090.1 hypothetical protein [Methylibium sp.]
MRRLATLVRVAASVAALVAASAAPAPAAEPESIGVRIDEPRAFGHTVGDVVTRRIELDVPRRLKLDERSLPQPGRVGQSFELREVGHSRRPGLRSVRHVLLLRYQVFRAVESPRVLDLPAFVLRFPGEPRTEELRIDYAPVGVTPLAPSPAALREGLGSLRPDVPPPAIETGGEQLRLAAYALVAAGLLVYLGYTIWGWAWWQRRHRPFSAALRRLRGLQRQGADDEALREAWRTLHAAIDATAGRVLDARAVEQFVAMSPRHAPLADELRWFFGRSQQVFFAGGPGGSDDAARLLALCRHGRAIERGLA